MVFSSPLFIFLFLPLVLLVHYLAPKKIKNVVLLIFSLLFYAWGERGYVLIMIGSIVFNYFIGLKIEGSKNRQLHWLILGIGIDLLSISYFKYGNFLIDNCNNILKLFNVEIGNINDLHLPIGISFFTFQAISYLIDVYRKETLAQKNLIDLGLYIALFPQLIAGPIVRYHDIAKQLKSRSSTSDKFVSGIERFITGLAKKLILANTFAYVADMVFALPIDQVSTLLSWIGIAAYALQIYFDFSAYSDMAIGLGRMLGFEFLENFNYPYISTSIQEFWRRWHISLSTWFRDYLYIPLGGNRVGVKRVYLNLIIVFFLTGLWHGASWSFIVWGLFHGFFLILERLFLGDQLKKVWRPLRHIYTLFVVLVGWVFFRVEVLSEAIKYIKTMFIFTSNQAADSHISILLTNEFVSLLIIGILFSTPFWKKIVTTVLSSQKFFVREGFYVGLIFLFFITLLYLSAGTYNPFIYFRF